MGIRTVKIDTLDAALAMVRVHGGFLDSVPESLRTPEVCQAAVQQNGVALRYVPWPLRTPEVCLAAVQQNGLALSYVPDSLQTPAVQLAAVQQHGWALAFVPDALRTPDLYLLALRQDPYVACPSRLDDLLQAAQVVCLAPAWLRSAQQGDTLETALDRVQSGLGAHCQVLAGMGLAGESLDAGLRTFLQPITSEQLLPELGR